MDDSRIDWILANQTRYYEILGVPKNADEREIRRSYHRLALQIHPDKNASNKKAAEACCVVMRAYEVLKDERLRIIYDQHGEEGLRRHEETGATSFVVVVRAILTFLLFRGLYAVASRSHAVETVEETFPSAWPCTPRGRAYEFARERKSQREASRRLVRKVYGLALLLLLCVSAGAVVFQAFGRMRGRDGCDADLYHILSRESSCNKDDAGAALILRSTSGRNTSDIAVWRPSGITEGHARRLLQRWAKEQCPTEQLLAWASRERYEQTATLRVRQALRAVRSPNRAAKRKWPPKRWWPKFEESFTVKSSDELFVASPLCKQFG